MLKTVVLAPVGPFRQELLAFVKSIPELELAGVAADLPELLLVTAHCAPRLVILADGPLCTPALDALQQRQPPDAPLARLVLAENRGQIQQAFAAGADGVLLKGFSTQEFLTALTAIQLSD